MEKFRALPGLFLLLSVIGGVLRLLLGGIEVSVPGTSAILGGMAADPERGDVIAGLIFLAAAGLCVAPGTAASAMRKR